jgi:poly-gamma-glutamate capsule biosynthesis protein CapA/YwtB (metallophosphatase superfamily)
MGTDIVSLANNHALDFGQDALIDTFSTLDTAGIDYVGAGENLTRAKSPVYKKAGDKTIAYVAASHVIFAGDWYATDSRPGMVGTYDPAMILESIKEARESSDFVVIYVHWGVEREHYPQKYQRKLAQKYIDAGADAVIGCHPHVMQGIEFYQGKPIAYSLGNYWFNRSNKESGMLKLYLDPDGTVRVQLLPVINKGMKTYLLTDQKEINNYYRFMQKLSYNVVFDENGFVSEDGK